MACRRQVARRSFGEVRRNYGSENVIRPVAPPARRDVRNCVRLGLRRSVARRFKSGTLEGAIELLRRWIATAIVLLGLAVQFVGGLLAIVGALVIAGAEGAATYAIALLQPHNDRRD